MYTLPPTWHMHAEMHARRVYCELLPYEDVRRPRTLGLLARYRLELVLAVRPWQLDELGDVARALRDHGVPLSLWPMLADEDGRWVHVDNAPAFSDLVRRACDRAPEVAREVLFDLEPPFEDVRGLTDSDVGGGHALRALRRMGLAAARARYARGRGELRELVRELDARGLRTSSAVWPVAALDDARDPAWQSLLGTPVDGLGLGRVSVMMYTSILEGWSRGVLARRDVLGLLAGCAVRARKRWGDGGGVSVGAVGAGAFADEPVYRSPRELAEDVAVARAAGATDLTLFDLTGVLAREPAEAWLDAFTVDDPTASVDLAPSPRARLARHAAKLSTRAVGIATRLLAR